MSFTQCPKCGKYTIYTDLFDKERQICENSSCGWSKSGRTEADIPKFLRKEFANEKKKSSMKKVIFPRDQLDYSKETIWIAKQKI